MLNKKATIPLKILINSAHATDIHDAHTLYESIARAIREGYQYILISLKDIDTVNYIFLEESIGAIYEDNDKEATDKISFININDDIKAEVLNHIAELKIKYQKEERTELRM